MKRSKIALITSGCLVTTPIVAFATGIIASCSKNASQDDDGISVSTKDVEVDHNNGVGTFDIILDEQPVDNAAYVYIITAEGPHHVELLDANPVVYNGHPAVLYDVQNGIAHVNIGFTEFVGETTKTVVGLEVRYNNRRGQWVLKHVNGINLTVTYVHNKTEEVHIFSLNDLHGVAEGYGEEGYETTSYKDPGLIRIAQKICPIIDAHPGSFLVSAGDDNSGDMFSTAVHGSSIYHMLQTIGARYSAVGNHSFEWGITPMATYQFDNWARTPDTQGNYFLASNILNGKLDDKKTWVSDPDKDGFKTDFAFWNSQRVGWADPYKIVNMNGHLVCLIGLTTSATLSDGNRSVVDNLSFIDYDHYTAAVNYSMYLCEHEVDPSLFNNIESIVLLTHVESGAKHEDGREPTGAAADLAANVKFEKVDAVISGHSHKLVNGTVRNKQHYKQVFVGQAESEGRKVLDLTFHFDNTKPVGQKKIGVSQSIIDFDMIDRFDPKTHEHPWEDAKKDLDYIKAHPLSPTVESVNNVFTNESNNITEALDHTILASRSDSLLYPASRKDIGHEYFINQRPADGSIPEDDGGYIIDQLGAWVARGLLTGFTQLFQEDIGKSTRGLTYPSIGFVTQDTMKIEYAKPAGSVDVTLRDMYNIQTYENTTKFGYLSIWQLANIINHSLAGQDIFNYEVPQANYYVPVEQSPDQPETKTPDTSLNNLSHYYVKESGTEAPFWGDAAPEKSFEDHGVAKGEKLKHTWCLYNCGPLQMYGVRFKVVRAAEGSAPDDAGRIWRLKNIEPQYHYPELADIRYFPDIYILDPLDGDDPLTPEPEKLYSLMQRPTTWMSAEQWCHKYGTMIPIVTNSFVYDGANWETPMVKVYMDYNADQDPKTYPVINFSQISRELLIAACEASRTYSQTFPFDMPISTLQELVIYPES